MTVHRQIVELRTPPSPRWYAYCDVPACGWVGRLRRDEVDASLDDYEHTAVCSSRKKVAA
jgi:hypothetical protein